MALKDRSRSRHSDFTSSRATSTPQPSVNNVIRVQRTEAEQIVREQPKKRRANGGSAKVAF